MKDWGWDEGELVRRCKEGSEAGYAELVRQHRPRLFALAFRLTNDRDTAEDVVQEAFLAAFRAIERFEPKPSLAAWLNTIAVRLAGKAATRRRDRPQTSLTPFVDDDHPMPAALAGLASDDASHDPHAVAETAELGRLLSDAIARLPFTMRTAVVLRHVVGLEYAEAAKAMDVPLNTYKSHLLRGTRQLRETLSAVLTTENAAGHASEDASIRAVEVEAGVGASKNGNGRRPRDLDTIDVAPGAGLAFPPEEPARAGASRGSGGWLEADSEAARVARG